MSDPQIPHSETDEKQERDEVVEMEKFKNEDSDSANEDDTTEERKNVNDSSFKLNIKPDDEGEDTPTLPLNKKKKQEKDAANAKKNPPFYIFPVLRLKLAWTRSSNVFEFLLRVIAIVFSTLGWLCCVGGVPLMSLAMLIIGSIYVKDCNIQPKIPVYLIVSGVFGTLQHFIAVWTKYIPKENQGPMRVYRAYCRVIDCTLGLFLMIWFVLGCIWVYGVPENIDFRDSFKDEYCNKTLYYFAFWMLNLSFILLLLLVVVVSFAIICLRSEIISKDEYVG